ncbi:helix-turn-helix domain-containing protein [Micromonospora sp. NBS 11-29]|uniref:helix-turn-helix domain-containing protein n=1 Tax=Micromonospora sp. NBS 11-29 TaxID=1960879 RepID=UPI0011200C26|nr:helix-turn-helix domain-containing protein [Micromonospora sp. NBS 11-29]
MAEGDHNEPDPARIVDRAQFAGALTAQREQAGLTVRQVAALVGVRGSVSTIGDWFSGRGLPSLSSQPLLLRVLEVCEVKPDAVEAWLAAWRRVRRRLVAPDSTEEPYRGLASFEAVDARWFFGRDRLTARLSREVEALRADGGGVLLLVGASGSGKSSLLRAGLVASLQPPPTDEAPPDCGVPPAESPFAWAVEVMTPGADPLTELAQRASTVAAASGPALLVVDQAEELFTLTAEHVDAFVRGLERLCAAPGRVVVVVALRADFYAQALRHPLLLRAAQSRQLTVGPMTRDELHSVIVGPAQRAGVEVEPGLVEVLLADVAGLGGDDAAETAALPLLSHALAATWRHDEGRRMTHAAYRNVGGVRGAVAATASAVYDTLDPSRQQVARRLLTALVHLGEDTVDTRRVVPTAALLAEFGADADAAEAVLELFVQHRLVTAEADTVQLSHEALLSAWPRLRCWLRADRAGLLIRQQLTTAAAIWQTDGHDPNALYRGTRLAAAQGWAAEHPALLSPPHPALAAAHPPVAADACRAQCPDRVHVAVGRLRVPAAGRRRR